jgi:hypothetical protein
MKAEDEEVKKERDNTLKRSIKDRENGTGEKRSRTGVKMEGGEEQGDSNTLGKDAPERQSKLHRKLKRRSLQSFRQGGSTMGKPLKSRRLRTTKPSSRVVYTECRRSFPAGPIRQLKTVSY